MSHRTWQKPCRAAQASCIRRDAGTGESSGGPGSAGDAAADVIVTQKMRSAMSTLLLCSEIVLVCSKLTIHSFLGRQSHTVPNQSPVSDSISPGIAAFIGGSVRCRGFARKLPSNGFSQLSQERIIQFFPSKERRTARFYVPCRQRKSVYSVSESIPNFVSLNSRDVTVSREKQDHRTL